jgi:TonB family protein
MNLHNLIAWGLQVGVVVVIAESGAAVLRLRVPKAKLLYWQLTLAICLVLPFIRTWKQDTIILTNDVAAHAPIAAQVQVAPVWSISIETTVIYLLALGSLARLGWLLAGFIRMGRFRRRSVSLPEQPQWGVKADLRASSEVTSPVTFGFLNPVILLPKGFSDMDQSHRDAILCHEFLHVSRHDWLFTVGEELIRAVLWFHPAIWWVLGEIQLAREQTVDLEAIEITRSRDSYVDALLTIAGAGPQPDLVPAPLFLRRRHLKQRVLSIFKEVRMSRMQAISAFAASLILLAASSWLVTGVIPLYGAPQVTSDAPGVAVETNGATLMHRSAVAYPGDAAARRIEGTVTVQVKVDDKGNVSDASVVSGPDELRKVVLQSVLNWHFTRDAANSTRQVAVTFQLPNAASVPSPVPSVRAVTPPSGVARGGFAAGPSTVKTIEIRGLSDPQRQELLALLPVHEGDAFTPDVLNKVGSVVRSYDEHLRILTTRSGPGEVSLVISAPETPASELAPPPPPPPPPPAPNGANVNVQPMQRIGSAVQAAKLVSQPKPVYPPLAKAARVQGTVSFDAVIGTDGRVANLTLLSGPPLLVEAAMTAVQQWVYQPTLLNGNPVSVVTNVDVNFTLAE